MANPERSTQEKVGHYAIYGGIVAGLIGLFTRADLFLAALGLVGGGYALKKTAKK